MSTQTTIDPPLAAVSEDRADTTIVDVQAWVMSTPVDPPWKIATALYDEMFAVFVEVELACGAVGWGEVLVRLAPGSPKAMIDEYFRPLLLGRDARNVAKIWDDLYWMFRTRGHSRGIVVEAISGVDIAIWDALGHAAGRPIADMLLGYGRTEIPCYASSVMVIDKKSTAREVERLLADGYRGIKIKVGQGVRYDAERIALAREMVGDDVEIMIDVNGTFDLAQATEFCGRVREHNVSWVEEPLLPDDLTGYRRLAATHPDVPLAAGEAEFTTAGFREFCADRLLTTWQPDVARAGGITGVTRIAALAQAYDISVSPHVGASAGVCAAASVQLAAAIPNLRIYEHMYMEHDLQDVFVEGRIRAVNSVISVPQGPGLGLTVDTAKVDRMKA